MSRRRLESGLIRTPPLGIRLLVTGGESSGPMTIRGAIVTPRNSRLKITKEPQLCRLRDELLLIPVNAQLGYRKRLAEGADKNTTHHPRINRSPGIFPVCASEPIGPSRTGFPFNIRTVLISALIFHLDVNGYPNSMASLGDQNLHLTASLRNRYRGR
jgi:hypothetical protein